MLVLVVSSDTNAAQKFGFKNFGYAQACDEFEYVKQEDSDSIRILFSSTVNSVHETPDILFFKNLYPAEYLTIQDKFAWSSWVLLCALVYSIEKWCFWSNQTRKMNFLQ